MSLFPAYSETKIVEEDSSKSKVYDEKVVASTSKNFYFSKSYLL